MSRRVHFSMIRGFHLADLFTIANGFCGVAALFAAMTFLTSGDRRWLWGAALLVPVALVFDVLDGRVARWRHAAAPRGRGGACARWWRAAWRAGGTRGRGWGASWTRSPT